MRKKIFVCTMIGTLMMGSFSYNARAMETDTEIGVWSGNEEVGTPSDAWEDIQAFSIDGDEEYRQEIFFEELNAAVGFEEINESGVFLKQQSNGRCTLTSNVMMLRRNAFIKGDENWQEITEDSAEDELWIEGTGMKWDYNFGDVSVKRVSTADMPDEEKRELFIALLAEHPEGIVIHDYSTESGYPHAVLLTDYTDGKFYCAEPANGYPAGRILLSESMNTIEGTDQYWYVSDAGSLDDVAYPTGIYFLKNDYTGYTAGITTGDFQDKSKIEYSWYASHDGGESFTCISDWKYGNEWLTWTPEQFGDYVLVGKTRVDGNESSVRETRTLVNYNPGVKNICQMPYTGEGGGFLIGFETYENPEQNYKYEVLILDCTLLAAGKPAWVYTTGQCGLSEGKTFWTIWQPKYGYYWTLFRVYDENGNLLDEKCYGFVNT